jgi:hypothetical protein
LHCVAQHPSHLVDLDKHIPIRRVYNSVPRVQLL